MTREKMCSPQQMFALLGWPPPKRGTNRAVSWEDLATEMGRRYDEAKRERLRQQEAA